MAGRMYSTCVLASQLHGILSEHAWLFGYYRVEIRNCSLTEEGKLLSKRRAQTFRYVVRKRTQQWIAIIAVIIMCYKTPIIKMTWRHNNFVYWQPCG